MRKETAANKAKIALSVGKLKAIIHQAYKQGERQATYDLFGEVPIECGTDPFEVRKTYVRSVVALACIHGDVPDAPISTAYRDEMRAQFESGASQLPIEPKWPKRVLDGDWQPPFGGQQITVLAVDEADADKQLRGILDRMPMVEGIHVETVSLIHPMFKEACSADIEAEKMMGDVQMLGVGYMYEGKRLDPKGVTVQYGPAPERRTLMQAMEEDLANPRYPGMAPVVHWCKLNHHCYVNGRCFHCGEPVQPPKPFIKVGDV